jgi:hypothetical protein
MVLSGVTPTMRPYGEESFGPAPVGRRAGGAPLPDLEHRTAFWNKRRSVLPLQYPTP